MPIVDGLPSLRLDPIHPGSIPPHLFFFASFRLKSQPLDLRLTSYDLIVSSHRLSVPSRFKVFKCDNSCIPEPALRILSRSPQLRSTFYLSFGALLCGRRSLVDPPNCPRCLIDHPVPCVLCTWRSSRVGLLGLP
ncbi:hypothetical protein TgHK011_009681 [Trichoderma gracile]|nr:hypothetical protein TgHK011_009681 [Trichoderma gracile]